jgi:hypothetical protein
MRIKEIFFILFVGLCVNQVLSSPTYGSRKNEVKSGEDSDDIDDNMRNVENDDDNDSDDGGKWIEIALFVILNSKPK